MTPHEQAVQELLQIRRPAAPALPSPVGELKFCFAVASHEGLAPAMPALVPRPPSKPVPSFEQIPGQYAL